MGKQGLLSSSSRQCPSVERERKEREEQQQTLALSTRSYCSDRPTGSVWEPFASHHQTVETGPTAARAAGSDLECNTNSHCANHPHSTHPLPTLYGNTPPGQATNSTMNRPNGSEWAPRRRCRPYHLLDDTRDKCLAPTSSLAAVSPSLPSASASDEPTVSILVAQLGGSNYKCRRYAPL